VADVDLAELREGRELGTNTGAPNHSRLLLDVVVAAPEEPTHPHSTRIQLQRRPKPTYTSQPCRTFCHCVRVTPAASTTCESAAPCWPIRRRSWSREHRASCGKRMRDLSGPHARVSASSAALRSTRRASATFKREAKTLALFLSGEASQ